MTDEYGIFNMRTNVGACREHDGGQAHTSLQKSWLQLQGIEELPFIMPRQGIEPLGSWIWIPTL